MEEGGNSGQDGVGAMITGRGESTADISWKQTYRVRREEENQERENQVARCWEGNCFAEEGMAIGEEHG